MLSNDLQLGSLYLLMAVMLIAGALIGRRSRFAVAVTVTLGWAVLFGAGFILFSFRDDLSYVAQRLQAEANGTPVKVGRQIRIPMALDGHFWIQGELNGVPVDFLVDSGATITTVGTSTAKASKLAINRKREQLVRTGNGVIRVGVGKADTLQVEGVTRRNLGVYVAENDSLNVLGMNFLSSLRRWGVEGRWLILEP